ncbi:MULTISPECIES: DUF262 domain-containing protein [Amycolatopsis]|uniref:DUF262 domain-containing protein n=1 Tax=Amycolatopsis TaxID=1813 RepID=UPI0013045137|nr:MULTISPECIES: DUF262 domain-containing protein [Amycolatopsis]
MTTTTPPNARFLDATQYSVAWFWKRLQADELDMSPPYQRNPVWQVQQKAFLIDSIIHGFPVPEIYLQTSISAEGDEIHTIVDGQQRIRACMEFIDGQYPLGDATPELEGLYFDDLDDEVRARIFRYKFVIRSLPHLSETEVREIFGRLNRNNFALNKQELRHSTYWGGFISAMEEFAQDPFWIKSGLFTSNDVRRMLDIEYISEIVIAGLYGLQNKKTRLDYFYATYESEFPDYEHARQIFDKVIAQVLVLLEWPNTTRWGRKVDFYTLFAELWRINERLPLNRKYIGSTRKRLIQLSDGVSRTLSLETLEDAEEDPAFIMYARGVRNSSDLGSRRLRSYALRQYVWGEEVPTFEKPKRARRNPHLAKLPSSEDLMEAAPDDQEDEDE